MGRAPGCNKFRPPLSCPDIKRQDCSHSRECQDCSQLLFQHFCYPRGFFALGRPRLGPTLVNAVPGRARGESSGPSKGQGTDSDQMPTGRKGPRGLCSLCSEGASIEQSLECGSLSRTQPGMRMQPPPPAPTLRLRERFWPQTGRTQPTTRVRAGLAAGGSGVVTPRAVAIPRAPPSVPWATTVPWAACREKRTL